MYYLDQEIYLGVYRITLNILKNNFFYSEDCLSKFMKDFTDEMMWQYEEFECTAHPDFLSDLQNDDELRRDFTSYFVSSHLHTVLVEDLHFTDMELHAFENILPKFMGANCHVEQSNERANH